MKRTFNPWFFVILIILGVVIFNQFNARPPGGAISYSEFTEFVRSGEVETVVIEQNIIRGELRAETQVGEGEETRAIREFQVTRVEDPRLTTLLENNGVTYEVRMPSQWLGLLVSFLPIIILIGFFWFVFMRAQGGPSQSAGRAELFGAAGAVDHRAGDGRLLPARGRVSDQLHDRRDDGVRQPGQEDAGDVLL